MKELMKKSTPLADAVSETQKQTGSEHIVAMVKAIVEAAREAGFSEDAPMGQVFNFLGTPEHELGKMIQ
jgi:hypothetical protein